MPSVLPCRIAASGSPVTTEKFQHWLLNEEGARIATSRISAIRAFGTGLSRKPRIERRPTTTSSKPGAPVTSPSRGLLELQLEPVPDFDQRARQFAHHRLVVRGAGGEAQAFGAARPGREIDRLHINPIIGEQHVADRSEEHTSEL